MGDIKEHLEEAVGYLSEHPAEARYTDSFAIARLGDSLRVEVEGPDGARAASDMPSSIGGHGEHPSPAWFYRAGLAACVASTMAMEAAKEGLALSGLEVEVDSESDDRGILGMDESVPAGPLSVRIRVRATAEGVDEGRLRPVLERGAALCPVWDATKRPVALSLELQTS